MATYKITKTFQVNADSESHANLLVTEELIIKGFTRGVLLKKGWREIDYGEYNHFLTDEERKQECTEAGSKYYLRDESKDVYATPQIELIEK